MAPRIVMTCGEPAGIGPELAVKALGQSVDFTWMGDPRHLPPGTAFAEIATPADPAPPGHLPVLRHDFAAPATPGRPNPANARGVIEVIARAVRLALDGATPAICTLPLNKRVLKEGAGFACPGHTEYLADLAGGVPVAMMLASTRADPPCRTVPATIHVPLDRVATELTPEGLERTIRITHAALIRDFGIPSPRLALAGLNPHAGEGGVIGRQEMDWIGPVADRLRAEGMALAGPLPADTMFHAAARARWDAAICCYHDQALIPIKTLDFEAGVNVTLGLPFVRTSPDHGTAFDIAGRGVADVTSTLAALRMARDLGARR